MSVLLATGGASGIGLACARQFLNEHPQNRVCIADKLIPESLVKELSASYDKQRLLFLQIDLTETAQLVGIFNSTISAFKTIDVVLNNAGTGILELIDVKDPEKLPQAFAIASRILDINLKAVINVSITAVHFMIKHKIRGHIVNVASMGGLLPQGSAPIYSASKHAVVGFSRSLFFLQREYGIRVNTLCPGFVETPLVTKIVELNTKQPVPQGQLTALGVTLDVSVISKLFLDLWKDEKAHGLTVMASVMRMREIYDRVTEYKVGDTGYAMNEVDILWRYCL